MNRLIKLFLISLSPWVLWGNSIIITPDTLVANVEVNEISNEIMTITNNNPFPVNLDITILEQTTRTNSLPSNARRFELNSGIETSALETDIQYQDENGNWIDGIRCATPTDTDDVLENVQHELELHRLDRNSDRSMVNIQVAWHVIHSSTGQGSISQTMIEDQIDVLNDAYQPYDIFFTLVSVDYTENDNWYGDMDQYESTYKQQLNIDPTHHLNIYTGNMPGLLGWSYLPYQWTESSYMHGVCLLYSSLPGGTAYPYNAGDTGTHEVGHYVGLLHTFENGCSANNDYVSDTPQENNGNNIYNCNNSDTCPNDPGMDPIHNFMTYTDDACLDQFTSGQGDRMENMIATYRPGLLENPVSPNWVYTLANTVQVPANSSTNLDFTFNSSDLNGGLYEAEIYFEESSMDTTLIVPSYMNVAGIPNLELSFQTLSDTLYPNEFSNNFLQMTYTGTDVFTYEFVYDIDWATLFGGDGTLQNGESQFITVNYNSLFMSPGTYAGEVTLNSNLGSIIIQLEMVLLEPLGTVDENVPTKFNVSDNFPNPFNPSTSFTISIPEQRWVNVTVYDLNGRKVVTLFGSDLDAGVYKMTWGGKNDHGQPVSAGVYILQLDAGKYQHNQKMIFLK